MSAPNRRPLHHVAPPLVALLVSSPALVGAATGSTPPLHALTIVAVALSVSWIGAALGVRLTAARVAPVPARRHATSDTDASVSTMLGRIEPARVPADVAIPGNDPAATTHDQDAAPPADAPAPTGGQLP